MLIDIRFNRSKFSFFDCSYAKACKSKYRNPYLTVVCSSFSASAESSKCRKGGSKVELLCKPADREGEFCPEFYRVVCGNRPDIVCKITPCHHVTYANECFECHDSTVKSYTICESQNLT